METVNEKVILSELINKFTEPAKYKIKAYQLIILMYIDQMLTVIINKYMRLKVSVNETKASFRTTHLQQSRLKLAHMSQKSFVIVNQLKVTTSTSFAKLQTMHENCLTHHDTPELFCEPYIHTGFRPINQPYGYYLRSLFTKHNETINAWSHYMGAIYTLLLIFSFDFSDAYSWPILVSMITSIIMFVSSATAHLMHQKSHYCHMTCFLCDFGGISFNGFGAAIMQLYCSSPIWYYKRLEPFILPLIGILSVSCGLLNSIAQTNYKRPYPPIKRFLQFAPCGVLWLFTMLPLFMSLWPETDPTQQIQINYAYHLTHICVFLIGAAFFALDFPQRFFPGKLDFFGQGHHLFHLCVFFVVKFQLKACYSDYLNNVHLIKQHRAAPTFSYCFISLIIIFVYYYYVIRMFTRMIAHNFDEHGNLKTKEKEDKDEINKTKFYLEESNVNNEQMDQSLILSQLKED